MLSFCVPKWCLVDNVTQNTHVVELYSRLVANEDQLTYYDSGIGTYVAEESIFVRAKQWVENALDMAIAMYVRPTSALPSPNEINPRFSTDITSV